MPIASDAADVFARAIARRDRALAVMYRGESGLILFAPHTHSTRIARSLSESPPYANVPQDSDLADELDACHASHESIIGCHPRASIVRRDAIADA